MDRPDRVIVLGASPDLGFCTAVVDGRACRRVINASESEHCEEHLIAKYKRTRSQRMELNSGYGRKEFKADRERSSGSSSTSALGVDRTIRPERYVKELAPEQVAKIKSVFCPVFLHGTDAPI